jgi:hypothetical protein
MYFDTEPAGSGVYYQLQLPKRRLRSQRVEWRLNLLRDELQRQQPVELRHLRPMRKQRSVVRALSCGNHLRRRPNLQRFRQLHWVPCSRSGLLLQCLMQQRPLRRERHGKLL